MDTVGRPYVLCPFFFCRDPPSLSFGEGRGVQSRREMCEQLFHRVSACTRITRTAFLPVALPSVVRSVSHSPTLFFPRL